MRTLLSLFDFSGAWARPFWDAGWNVIQVDIKHGEDICDFSCRYIIENYLDGCGTVDGILIAVPCTDFVGSGAAHWKSKDADGRTAASVHLVRQSMRTVEFLKPDFWALENPVGRIQKLAPEIGPARLRFDPCDFACWLASARSPRNRRRLESLRSRDGAGQWSQADVEMVKRCNAYTKKTVLYGAFNAPLKRRIEPVKVCAQGSWLQRLGGRSEATKEARSMTPGGFARAFFEANHDRALDWEAIEEGCLTYEEALEVSQTGDKSTR